MKQLHPERKVIICIFFFLKYMKNVYFFIGCICISLFALFLVQVLLFGRCLFSLKIFSLSPHTTLDISFFDIIFELCESCIVFISKYFSTYLHTFLIYASFLCEAKYTHAIICYQNIILLLPHTLRNYLGHDLMLSIVITSICINNTRWEFY